MAQPRSWPTEQLERFERILSKRTGLSFDDRNRGTLAVALGDFLDAHPSMTVEETLARLMDESDEVTLRHLVSSLTVRETYFFRNPAHFEILEQRVLPGIVERNSLARRLRIWSAGCSTGEEAYSIAIALVRSMPGIAGWHVSVLGTDINEDALARAREGLYTDWSFRGTDEAFRSRYFDRVEGGWRVRRDIRRMVTFASHNLATDPYPSHENNTSALDVIFCRNVTIYFNRKTTLDITARFYSALVDGGWLFMGHAESSLFIDPHFIRKAFPDAIVFRKEIVASPGRTARRPARGGRLSVLAKRWADRHGAPQRLPGEAAAATAPATDSPSPDDATTKAGSAIAPLRRAREALSARDFSRAARCAREAVAKDALLTEGYYLLGVAEDALGDPQEALRLLRRCLYLDRSHVPAHWTRAGILMGLGRCEQARRSLENTLRLVRETPDSRDLDIAGGRMTVGELKQLAASRLSRCLAAAGVNREGDVDA